MSFLITFLALSAVIFIHELGHLLAAKWSNIGVYEFAIGMGPRLFGKKWGETEYSVRLFPIGGFVKLAGMDDESTTQAFHPSRHLNAQSAWARLLTIGAGSLANVILGFIIFVAIYSGFGVHLPTSIVESVVADTPSMLAGLQPNDHIVSLNGAPIENGEKFITALQAAPAGPITLKVIQNNTPKIISITPIEQGNRRVIGVVFALTKEPIRLNPIQAVQWGTKTTWSSIRMVFYSAKMIILGKVKPKEMAGVVGIVQMASFGYHQGFDQFLGFMAMISISLGVFNLFPLPALDGGHLTFLLIEVIRRKPLNPKWESIITNTGFALLIALMVVILFNDVRHWTDRNKTLQTIQSR